MANKSGGKPMVNWMKRKKEVSYSDSTDAKGQNYKIKTKVVTAPESRTSKPMEKKVVKVTTKRKQGGNMAAGVLGGTAMALGSMAAKKDATQNKMMAAGLAIPIAQAVAQKIRSKVPKTVSKTKTKTK